MATEITTRFPVYRHASDDQGKDCGRACAQMVIASVALGLQGVGSAQPVPETQQSIRDRETYEAANPGFQGPGEWFTFPDELVQVLQPSAQFGGPLQNVWYVARHTPTLDATPAHDVALQKLLTDIVAGLKRGLPSVLNIRANDHWVTVANAWVNNDGSVSAIRFADPLFPSSVASNQHTYIDACEAQQTYWMTESDVLLAEFELAVAGFLPNDYEGDYIAVVPGPVRRRGLLMSVWWIAWVERVNNTMAKRASAPPPVPPIPTSRTDIKTGLQDVAAYLGVPELNALLGANVPIVFRTVRDIEGSDETYLIGSMFDSHQHQGLIGIFNSTRNGVSSSGLTRRDDFHGALGVVPETESLWWTRRRLTIGSFPFYPFRQVRAGKFGRLADGILLEYR